MSLVDVYRTLSSLVSPDSGTVLVPDPVTALHPVHLDTGCRSGIMKWGHAADGSLLWPDNGVLYEAGRARRISLVLLYIT